MMGLVLAHAWLIKLTKDVCMMPRCLLAVVVTCVLLRGLDGHYLSPYDHLQHDLATIQFGKQAT